MAWQWTHVKYSNTVAFTIVSFHLQIMGIQGIFRKLCWSVSIWRVSFSTDHRQEDFLDAVGNTRCLHCGPVLNFKACWCDGAFAENNITEGDAHGCLMSGPGGIGTESLERSPTVGWVCWRFLQKFTLPVSQAVPIIKCPSCSMNYTWGYVWIGPWRISRSLTSTHCLHFFGCNNSWLIFISLLPSPSYYPCACTMITVFTGISNSIHSKMRIWSFF